MKKRLFLLFILVTGIAFSADEAGGTAGAFLRVAADARAASLGNAVIALSDDANASYGNPAILPFLERKQFSSSFQFLSLDRSHSTVLYGLPLPPNAGMAVSWVHAGVSDIIGRNDANEPTYNYRFSQNSMNVSFGLSPVEGFSFGLTARVINETVSSSSSNGFSVDVGMCFSPVENLNLGLVYKNATGKVTWDTSQESYVDYQSQQTDEFPSVFQAGLSYILAEKYLFTAAYNYSEQIEPSWHLGTEMKVGKILFLRAGLNDGTPALGAGTFYPVFRGIDSRLDYALLLASAGEGMSHLFTWTFYFKD